jgi:hypothetical protein
MKVSTKILVVGMLVLPVFCAHAGLIENGSFETPTVNVGSWGDYGSGSTAITGWTVVGCCGVSLVSGTFVSGSYSFPAEDGQQFLDLTGDQSNSLEGVEQTVATTPGVSYTLSFYVGNISGGTFGASSSVEVLLGGIGGTALGTVTNSDPGTTLSWEQYSFQFTATGSSTTIDFMNQDPSYDDNNGLDNVQLTQSAETPEPGTLSLLGGGLLIGLGRWRRRKAF